MRDYVLELGITLRTSREIIGKTIGEVAKELGLSKGTLNSWEKGIKSPPKTRLPFLPSAYGVDPDFLKETFSLIEKNKKMSGFQAMKGGQKIKASNNKFTVAAAPIAGVRGNSSRFSSY